MSDKKGFGFTTDEQLKLAGSEQRFRAAEIAGDTTAMQLELDSKPAADLRRKRDTLDAVEMTQRAEAHLKIRLERPITFFARALYTYVNNLSREIILYRRFSARRLKNLEDRLAASEQSAALRYCGVWHSGMEAKMGTFWTDRGSLWACLRDTNSRPGSDPSSWQLAAKSGKGSSK